MKSPQRGQVWLVGITLPHAKLVRTLGQLSDAQLGAVERVVCTWLGLATAKPEA